MNITNEPINISKIKKSQNQDKYVACVFRINIFICLDIFHIMIIIYRQALGLGKKYFSQDGADRSCHMLHMLHFGIAGRT